MSRLCMTYMAVQLQLVGPIYMQVSQGIGQMESSPIGQGRTKKSVPPDSTRL